MLAAACDIHHDRRDKIPVKIFDEKTQSAGWALAAFLKSRIFNENLFPAESKPVFSNARFVNSLIQ